MFLVGLALIALAVVAFMAAKERSGEAKLAGKPFLENAVALLITTSGAVGVVVTFVGLARL